MTKIGEESEADLRRLGIQVTDSGALAIPIMDLQGFTIVVEFLDGTEAEFTPTGRSVLAQAQHFGGRGVRNEVAEVELVMWITYHLACNERPQRDIPGIHTTIEDFAEQVSKIYRVIQPGDDAEEDLRRGTENGDGFGVGDRSTAE